MTQIGVTEQKRMLTPPGKPRPHDHKLRIVTSKLRI
jgi:hypothetical protein